MKAHFMRLAVFALHNGPHPAVDFYDRLHALELKPLDLASPANVLQHLALARKIGDNLRPRHSLAGVGSVRVVVGSQVRPNLRYVSFAESNAYRRVTCGEIVPHLDFTALAKPDSGNGKSPANEQESKLHKPIVADADFVGIRSDFVSAWTRAHEA